MKKTTAIFLCLSLIFCLCACGSGGGGSSQSSDQNVPSDQEQDLGVGSEVEVSDIPQAGPEILTGQVSLEYYGEEDIAYLGTAEYVYLTSPGYDGLQRALLAYNDEMRSALEQSRADAAELLGYEDIDWPSEVLPFTDSTTVRMQRNDSSMLSFISYNEGYFGGAHGWYGGDGYSYDTETGDRLKLRDITPDYDNLVETIINELAEINEAEYGGEFYSTWEDTARELLSGDYGDWCSTQDGLDVWFDIYVLGSYAMGMVDVYLDTGKHPDIYSAKYMPGGNATPCPIEESSEKCGTYLYNNVVLPIGSRFGEMEYEACRSFLEEDTGLADYDIVFDVPWESESCGSIDIQDIENDCTLTIFFEPRLDINEEPDCGGPVYVDEMWYRSENYCACFFTDYWTGDRKFRFIDYINCESTELSTPEELTKLMFLCRTYME